jgi:bifunctional non-homologous end joining protein LigD
MNNGNGNGSKNPDPTHCDSVTLYYRQGSSDKVYQAWVAPKGDGLYAVEYAYGRRGSTLKTGIKTREPVPHTKAHEILWKLVRQKMDKGYTPGEDGTPYASTEREGQTTGIACQLLNPVDGNELAARMADDRWVMQRKFDGRRLLVKREGDEVTGINRRGLETGIPATIRDTVLSLPADRFVIDGEAVDDLLHAFDLLELGGADLRSQPYEARLAELEGLLAGHHESAIVPVATAYGRQRKEEFLMALRAGNREGAVLKDLAAPCTPGRPASGGSQLKYKFYATASCVVTGRNHRQSVELALVRKDGFHTMAGNVSIPPNHPVPEAGSVVEVRYLYAFRDSGKLYQPVYLGARDDIAPEECTIDQLKYKAA